MPLLREILCKFPDEPWLSKNNDDGAIRWRRNREVNMTRSVTRPVCNRQTDRRLDGNAMTIEHCSLAKLQNSKNWRLVKALLIQQFWLNDKIIIFTDPQIKQVDTKVARKLFLTLLANKCPRSITSNSNSLQESLANAKVSVRQPCWSKTDYDVKLALKVILGHSFCSQLQADKR